jgi:hypothetical protein
MRLCLCTTTIHVPHALKLMRQCDPDVHFFLAADAKTPKGEVSSVMCETGNVYLAPYNQGQWKCSEAIGWNTLARRNIAFLEALKWKADVIYSWDNDNLPVDYLHFENIEKLFVPTRTTQSARRIDGLMVPAGTRRGFDGIKVTGDEGWFDPGSLLIPPTRHRGIPHNIKPSKHAHPVVGAKIGVAAGLVIGAGDADACTQIEHRPDISNVHILGSAGIVVDPSTHTVWNSQNTAVVRELIPAWFMAPGCARHDDIYASLIVQRVMRERGYHVHFGPPFCYHERNEHNLLSDLRAEIDGMSNVKKMAKLLDAVQLPGKSVIDDTRIIYETLQHADWYPKQACIAAFAYLEDCEGVI